MLVEMFIKCLFISKVCKIQNNLEYIFLFFSLYFVIIDIETSRKIFQQLFTWFVCHHSVSIFIPDKLISF